jgi:aspartate kinase
VQQLLYKLLQAILTSSKQHTCRCFEHDTTSVKVLKFGGTSMGTPERMQAVAELINDETPKVVVLSAVAGTTNALQEIADDLYQQDKSAARTKIKSLEASYEAFIATLYSAEETRAKARGVLNAYFDYIGGFTCDLFTLSEERAVMAQGELISTNLFHLYLSEQGIDSVLLPALEFMRIDRDGEPDQYYIKKNIGLEIDKHPGVSLYITQGYICRNAFGELDNLKRGGSDYTASLLGVAVEADEIQIWTDIDGMRNNDPRVVDDTHPIQELSYDEAAELAYFGAKILHPLSVRPAQDANIQVLLKNTLNPTAKGTVIKAETTRDNITAIAAKDNIIAIKIRSGRMLMAYGFLRNVFEVFERFRTPIDMITTSEVAVSLTIDDATHLDRIKAALQEFGSVEVDHNMSIVCVVGDFLAEKQGTAHLIMGALKDIPLRMISYGGSKNNISFLVETTYKAAALNALNVGLFQKIPMHV